jgi:hypothetical protein
MLVFHCVWVRFFRVLMQPYSLGLHQCWSWGGFCHDLNENHIFVCWNFSQPIIYAFSRSPVVIPGDKCAGSPPPSYLETPPLLLTHSTVYVGFWLLITSYCRRCFSTHLPCTYITLFCHVFSLHGADFSVKCHLYKFWQCILRCFTETYCSFIRTQEVASVW